MGRLIDAEKLKNALQEWLDEICSTVPYKYDDELHSEILSDCIDFVEDAPKVDAVPVVRCEDCVWFVPGSDCALPYCTHPSGFIGECGEYFYCCNGVRKEANDDAKE